MKELLRQLFHRDHVIVALLTIAIIKLMVFVVLNLSFLSPVVRAMESFSMTDIYYWIQSRTEPTEVDPNITLVDMTDITSRADIAKLIRQIRQKKPAALGVDIIFEGRKFCNDEDEILAEACLETDEDPSSEENTGETIVWAYKLTEYDDETDKFQNSLHSFFITEGLQCEGFVNMVSNPAKSISDYAVTLPYRDTVALSLPAQITRMVNKEELSGEARHNIDYKNVNFLVVKHDELPDYRQFIEGHIVLLGEMRTERDKYNTPIGQKSGLEILAYTIRSMTDDLRMTHAGPWVILLWAIIAGCVINITDFMLTKRIEKRHSTIMLFITQSEFYDKIISFIVMMLFTWASFHLFARHNYFVDTVLALSTIVLIDEGRLLYVALLTLLKKKTKWKWVRKSIYYDERH